MLVLVWLLTVLLMMKSGAAFTKVINAQSGEAVLLLPDQQEWERRQDVMWGPVRHRLGHKQDVRWTHPHLVVRSNSSRCHHGRCELLSNGSLRFSHVQAEDSGNYSLEVFSEDGELLMKSDFVLNVTAGSSGSSSSSSSGSTVAAVVSVLLCCFTLVIFIFIFIKRRRSQNASATTDPLQDNIYVEMRGNRGNKRKGEEEEKKQEKEKQEEEEESHYVCCNAVVSLETPTTPSVDVEDIYV